MIEWNYQAAEYRDEDTTAEILKGKLGDHEVYRLSWNDGVANEWHEDFPTLDLARRRLSDLITALTRSDKGFTESYHGFLGAELGHEDAIKWEAHEFLARLRERGYHPRLTELGGGLQAFEVTTHDRRVIAWAETNEGYPRVGIYPAHLMYSGDMCAVIDFAGSGGLADAHGDQLASLLDLIAEVVGEVQSPHTHEFKEGHCVVCGDKIF
jgi:hypothetical protein